MKNKLTIIALLILSFISKEINAQKHYIVVIDRINNTKTYKQKDFKNGRPAETDIKTPEVKKGDIITVRMINFNELIYGLYIKSNLIEKPKSLVSDVLRTAEPVFGLASMSPTMGMLSSLLMSPPSITRGEAGEKSAASLHKRLVKVMRQVAETEAAYNDLSHDEGLTLDELKNKINDLDSKFNGNSIKNEYKKIETDVEQSADSTSADWLSIIETISTMGGKNIEDLSHKISDLKNELNLVDFVSETTFIVENESRYSDEVDYEKFNIKANVYKRVELITLNNISETQKQYKKKYDSDNPDDQLNQSFDLNFKIKNKYKPYFSIAINRIFVPSNRYSYAPVYDNLSDSIKFSSVSVGGAKTSIGMSLNFDVPIHLQSLSFAGTIGYSMAFWKSQNDFDGESSNKKGFVTTGISIGHKKFKFINLAAGAAWGEYSQLSPKYQADKFIENNLSAAEISGAVSKKIKPAFYVGLSINL